MSLTSGRSCLRADAGYCGIAAVCTMAFAKPLGSAFGMPAVLLLGVALVTALWAGLLLFAATGSRLRLSLAGVMGANVIAASLIAALGLTRPADALSLLLLAVAVEVGAFAAWQAFLLSRGPSGKAGGSR
ncbi:MULTISPECIES: hypothetical protein [Thermomonosporaceae]|uniref:hypothetical protein n=1 Tax=Thermomonosporaceae TaxID=2012 RepID=UPI00255AD066|nr:MULTISPECIES: hypothetical protein [Thermomonosporaceae]MDL4775295.1 hypothetical protein [Actinomadura xylanilytica]